MTILLLLCLLFILVIIKIIYSPPTLLNIYEGYYDSNDVNVMYSKFITFYTTFCPLWQKAISTAVMANTSQQPLTSPSQISDQAGQSGSQPSASDMDSFIQQLSATNGKQYANICTDFPNSLTNLTTNALQDVANRIPSDSTPYMNALNWMNMHMTEAHANYAKALTGNLFKEGFDNCQQIQQCIANDPEILQMQQNQINQQIFNSITSFFSNEDELMSTLQQTQDLVEASNAISNDAQSGGILNKINIAEEDIAGILGLPDGANNLGNLKDSNPQRYGELKSNYSLWFNLKTLMEEINNNLNN
jgi:hypothetical protein